MLCASAMRVLLKGRLMETIKLYDYSAYMTEFDATVLSSEPGTYEGHDIFKTILDQTLFFPEEGGQSPDKGNINDADVLYVKLSSSVIIHYLNKPIPAGAHVHGKIDFQHRYSNMQQHSGEHIFSGIVNSVFHLNNVGFHLSDNSVTMDYDGVLSKEEILHIEHLVNRAIWENVEIKAYYPTAEELKNTDYRSKKELTGPIRIVAIPGYDICACCAPHVKRTGEIGILKVISFQNHKGGIRLHILCGERALKYFNESLDLVTEITNSLTTGKENIVTNIEKMKDEIKSLNSSVSALKYDLIMNEIKNMPKTSENVILFKEKTDSFIMRNVVNSLVAEHEGYSLFFSGDDETGYNYIIGCKVGDAREIQKKLNLLGAHGGGKAQMIQGSIKATRKEIEEILL